MSKAMVIDGGFMGDSHPSAGVLIGLVLCWPVYCFLSLFVDADPVIVLLSL